MSGLAHKQSVELELECVAFSEPPQPHRYRLDRARSRRRYRAVKAAR
jgi:hypothetical protein